MRHRLADVGSRLDKLSPDDEKVLQKQAQLSTKRRSAGRAMKLGTDLIAGVAVGGLIGYGIDHLFGTGPIGLIVFFLLGVAAGFLNVFRTARQLQEEQAELVRQGKLDLGHDLPDNDDDD